MRQRDPRDECIPVFVLLIDQLPELVDEDLVHPLRQPIRLWMVSAAEILCNLQIPAKLFIESIGELPTLVTNNVQRASQIWR